MKNLILEQNHNNGDYDLSDEEFSNLSHSLISNLNINNLNETIKLHNRLDTVLLVYSTLIVLFGTLFNLLNFGCFYRMKKRSSQNIYLGALSIADLLNIYVNILIPLLKRLIESEKLNLKLYIKNFTLNWFKKDISNEFTNFLSILYGYLVEVCLLIPVWIMVILSAERFLSIMWPLKKNILSTRKNANITLIILCILICTWSLFKLESAGVETYSTFEKEVSSENGRNITLPMIVNISTTLWAIIPEFLTLIFNLFIINQIKIASNLHKKFYPSEHSKKITQATRVVIFLSLIFICLISPTGVLIILDIILNRDKESFSDTNLKRVLEFMIARKFVIMFYETSLIINFPIYLLTIKNFKQTLKNLMPKFQLLNRKDSTKIGVSFNNNQNRIILKKINSKNLKRHMSEMDIIQLNKNGNLIEEKRTSKDVQSLLAAKECAVSLNGSIKANNNYNNINRLASSSSSSFNDAFKLKFNNCQICYNLSKKLINNNMNNISDIDFNINNMNNNNNNNNNNNSYHSNLHHHYNQNYFQPYHCHLTENINELNENESIPNALQNNINNTNNISNKNKENNKKKYSKFFIKFPLISAYDKNKTSFSSRISSIFNKTSSTSLKNGKCSSLRKSDQYYIFRLKKVINNNI